MGGLRKQAEYKSDKPFPPCVAFGHGVYQRNRKQSVAFPLYNQYVLLDQNREKCIGRCTHTQISTYRHICAP